MNSVHLCFHVLKQSMFCASFLSLLLSCNVSPKPLLHIAFIVLFFLYFASVFTTTFDSQQHKVTVTGNVAIETLNQQLCSIPYSPPPLSPPLPPTTAVLLGVALLLFALHDPQTGQQPLPQPLKQKMKSKNV